MRVRISVEQITKSGVVVDGRTKCTDEGAIDKNGRCDCEMIGMCLSDALQFLARPNLVLAKAITVSDYRNVEIEQELNNEADRVVEAWKKHDVELGI